ncbi:MAG: HepT-like ribonuclease domain-containing protein [Limisphaerales bacterium]
MLPSTVELLRDILREAEFLAAQSAQTTEAEFLHNEVLKRAFVRSLEVIGEATKKSLTTPGSRYRNWSGGRWPG